MALALEKRNGRLRMWLRSLTRVLGWGIWDIRSVGRLLVLSGLRMVMKYGWDGWEFDIEDIFCGIGPLGSCLGHGGVISC